MWLSKACLLLIILLTVPNTLSWLSGALKPLGLAFCAAYLLQPLVNRLQRLSRLPRWICVLISFLLILCALTVFIFLFIPKLSEAIRILLTLDFTTLLSQPVLSEFARLLPLQEWLSQLPSLLQHLFHPLLRYGASALQWAGNLCMAFCIAYYALKESSDLCLNLSHYICRLLPRRGANVLLNLMDILDRTFWIYLRGRFCVSLILTLFTTLFFFLFNLILRFSIPSPILLGFILGLTNLIPLIGPLLGTGFCLLLALFAGFPETLAVLALCLAAQLLDNLYLTPRLGAPFGLSPFWILSGVTLFSVLFGIVGMLLSIPILASCAEIWRKYERSPGFLFEKPRRFA